MEELFEVAIEGLMAEGYSITTGFLSLELMAGMRGNLLAHRTAGHFHAAGVGKGKALGRHDAVRLDQVLWIEENSLDGIELAFLARIQAFTSYLNETCFAGIRGSEFHYAWYAEGSFYKKHLDQFRGDAARRYSVICYLNPLWVKGDGGELLIHATSGAVLVAPLAGTMVIFESGRLLHEVLISQKDRFSITGWLK